MFSERPLIPLAILLHDTKQDYAHDRFIQTLSMELPDLHKKCILVTDAESALKNAFRQYYPQLMQFRCWNHAFKNLRFAAKKSFCMKERTSTDNQMNSDKFDFEIFDGEADSYEEDADQIDLDAETNEQKTKRELITEQLDMIRELLRADSRADFLLGYHNVSASWPYQFRRYFEKKYLPTIDELGEYKIIYRELLE